MSNLKDDEILERLRQQRKLQKLNIRTKKITKKKYAPTTKLVEQQNLEDENVRHFLSEFNTINVDDVENNIVKSGYGLFLRSKKLKGNQVTSSQKLQLWKDLDVGYKNKYILEVYGSKPGGAWHRKEFFQRIISSGNTLLIDFITKYLKQPLNYDKFYDIWVQEPYVASQIDKERVIYELKEEEEHPPEVFLDRETIRNDAISKAKLYAKKHNIPITKNSYYSILLEILNSKKPNLSKDMLNTNIQKLHIKINKELIKRAKKLGIENPAELKLGELSTKIIQYSKNKSPIVEREKKKRVHVGKMVYDPAFETTVDIKYDDMSTPDLQLLAKKQNLIEPETEYDRDTLLQKVIQYDIQQSGYADPRNIQLVHKLSRITRKSPRVYFRLSLSELEDMYTEIINNPKYKSKVKREEDIDKLVKITGKKEVTYDDLTLKEIQDELSEQESLLYNKAVKDIYQNKIKHNKKCIQQIRSYSWIKYKVVETYISKANNHHLDMSFVNDNRESIKKEGKIWYSVNNNFYLLQCTSKKRVQDGNVLTCISEEGKRFDFMVGYTISIPNKKFVLQFIIQDEELFKKEIEYLRTRNSTYRTKINDLLNKSIDTESTLLVSRYISQELLKVAPNQMAYKDYTTKTAFVPMLVKNIKDDTKQESNRVLFTAVANIVIYLQIPESKVFKTRIKYLYYDPVILSDLSPEDKFPELFSDPDVDDIYQKSATSSICSSVKNIVIELVNKFYIHLNPTAIRHPQTYTPLSIILKKNVNSEDNNPEDNNPDNDYDNNNPDNDYDDIISEEEVPKVSKKDMVIPDLWKILTKDIKEREEDIAKDAGIKEDEEEEDDEKYESLESADEEKTRRGDSEVDKKELCEYCNKFISGNSEFKSVIHDNNKSRIVKFCTIKCFEDKGWPKIKKKKNKKKKNRKMRSNK